MKKAILLPILLAGTIQLAQAACDKPAAPELPDPDQAVTAQMVKAKNDMTAYIGAAEAYLKCVQSDTKRYNDMVDEMQKAADTFNSIVRKYKERMSS